MMIEPVDVLSRGFFFWCQHTGFGAWVQKQQWVFAVLETVHILAFSILLGTTISVDLRLLDFGLRRQSVHRIAHELDPWTWVSLSVTMITGVLLFMSEAVRLSISPSFFYKMLLFTFAIVLHFTIHRKATSPGASDGAWFGKVAACLSLMSWFGVALAGRAIGFLG
jgi:hypothetical protein